MFNFLLTFSCIFLHKYVLLLISNDIMLAKVLSLTTEAFFSSCSVTFRKNPFYNIPAFLEPSDHLVPSLPISHPCAMAYAA